MGGVFAGAEILGYVLTTSDSNWRDIFRRQHRALAEKEARRATLFAERLRGREALQARRKKKREEDSEESRAYAIEQRRLSRELAEADARDRYRRKQQLILEMRKLTRGIDWTPLQSKFELPPPVDPELERLQEDEHLPGRVSVKKDLHPADPPSRYMDSLEQRYVLRLPEGAKEPDWEPEPFTEDLEKYFSKWWLKRPIFSYTRDEAISRKEG